MILPSSCITWSCDCDCDCNMFDWLVIVITVMHDIILSFVTKSKIRRKKRVRKRKNQNIMREI